MNEIKVAENKTLKLTNVVSRRIAPEELGNMMVALTQLQNFIKSHNAQPIGPLVQAIKIGHEGFAASAAGLVLHAHRGRDGLRDVDGQIPCVKYAAKNRAGKQASACTGGQRRQVDCRSGGRMMGFDFLLVQPQAFIEKKKPRLSR